MRVATSTLYHQGLASMNNQQSSLLHVQQQLGTGRRILTPSDDPVAATRALSVSQAGAVNGQYTTSRKQANSSLGQEENTLQTVTTTLQNIKTLLVNAGNGTMSDNDRASLATTLQGQYDQLLGLANADDGNGNYLFSGLQSGTVPFAKNAAGGAVYQGDTGHQLLQVDVSRQMETGNNGSEVFLSVTANAGYVLKGNSANTGTGTYSAVTVSDPADPLYGHSLTLTFQTNVGTGKMQYSIMDNTTGTAVGTPTDYSDGVAINVAGVTFAVKGTPADGDTMSAQPAQQAGADMFANLQNVINALRTPINVGTNQPAADANLQNVIATGLRQFDNSLDNVLTVRSSVGSRMQELDALDTIGQNRDVSNAKTLSDLQDLDYAAAITEYYQRQTALQGAQQSFMQIQGMNLFQYL
ncbi:MULTISPECIES: flagellar hook-associated protein FlgL [unclassified Cupriavidus]|uniref:flagellar hook-associated protein FlgL n=1 Tax=unclassified Cupriavidus TaxID=2640874 RepID=UPI000881633F|nr:flagellar hook-associated protein FlgL [Cupriavidus sp. YR651]SDD63092.1 flagellar hook-associated protein 3 FlgL [Cupriavidus sp. YR651]